MRNKIGLFTLSILLLLWSCAGISKVSNSAPDWFNSPPTSDKEYLYFTLSVEGVGNVDINDTASDLLYRTILEYVGITSDVGGEEYLSEFKDKISWFIRGGRLEGFNLIEKVINENRGTQILYFLVQVKQDNLELWEEQLVEDMRAGSSASVYSKNAAKYIDQGNYFEGAVSYIRAALESAESDNHFLTERNLLSAISLIDSMTLNEGVHPEKIAVGENVLFSAKIGFAEEEPMGIWDNIPFRVSFLDRKKGTIIEDRFARLRSEGEGIVNFVHPPPGFTGKGRVILSFDLFRDFESVEKLENKFSERLDQLRTTASSLKLEYNFNIVSSAPRILTSILILDSDFLRKPLDSSHTANGLLGNLLSQGFQISLLEEGRQALIDKSEKEFLRDLPYIVAPGTKRVIFGRASIEEFNDSATGFSIVTKARIKAVDIDTGELLFDETLNKRVQGGESQSTINTAFKELGKSFSSLIIDKLP